MLPRQAPRRRDSLPFSGFLFYLAWLLPRFPARPHALLMQDLPTGQLPTWFPLDMCVLEQVALSATRRCLEENPRRCRSIDTRSTPSTIKTLCWLIISCILVF